MIPFSQWAKQNDIDIETTTGQEEFKKQAGFTGDLLGQRDIGEHSFTYKGKPFYFSGSRESKQLLDPVRQAFEVVRENKKQAGTESNPINFSNIVNGLEGISLAGYIKDGKFVEGDRWDSNGNWISREPVIKLTSDFNQDYKKGDYIAWSDMMKLYKNAHKLKFNFLLPFH